MYGKRTYLAVFLFWLVIAKSQQTPIYTQYTFNKAGTNPAASGTDITQKYYYVFGLNRLWAGFENAPKNNFVNFSYTIRPPRAYKFWQNIGVYADNQDAGLMDDFGIYFSYSVHTLLRKKLALSFGLFAGARKYSRSLVHFDQNDPAIQNNATELWLYPDIVPGIRLSNKRFFVGASVRNITINKLQSYGGQKMGSPSRLLPSVYVEFGKTIEISEQVLFMPSVALHIPILGPPVAEGTIMYYFVNRIGAGVSLRNTSFASGILQVRFLKNMTAGFAYSYPLNKMRGVSGHSYEFMIGITPLGMNIRLLGVNGIVKCPTLTY